MMGDTSKKKKGLKNSQRIFIIMFAFSTLFIILAVVFYPKTIDLDDDTFFVVLFTVFAVYLIIIISMFFLLIRAKKKENLEVSGDLRSSLNTNGSVITDSGKEQISSFKGPVKRACDNCGEEVMEGEICKKCGIYAIIKYT